MSGVTMGTRYSHFSLDERCRLRGLMEMALKVGEISRRLGRHRGTLYREIARNCCVAEYRPDSADRMAWVRKLRGSKIHASDSGPKRIVMSLPADCRSAPAR